MKFLDWKVNTAVTKDKKGKRSIPGYQEGQAQYSILHRPQSIPIGESQLNNVGNAMQAIKKIN